MKVWLFNLNHLSFILHPSYFILAFQVYAIKPQVVSFRTQAGGACWKDKPTRKPSGASNAVDYKAN
jgi:hypothetical protein